MTGDIFDALPARTGHFCLESGYHSDLWLDLDAMFITPRKIAPLVDQLAVRLRSHQPDAVGGPLQGGALLAHQLAAALDLDFYFTVKAARAEGDSPALFAAQYRLPPAIAGRVRGQRVAVVDDVVSAGSSVRATVAAIHEAGGTVVVIGTLLLMGAIGRDHFEAQAIPVEALSRRDFTTWTPDACPLCARGIALESC